ncbi:hypothetical protein MRX96_007558 [Rhipicephalus microplus]
MKDCLRSSAVTSNDDGVTEEKLEPAEVLEFQQAPHDRSPRAASLCLVSREPRGEGDGRATPAGTHSSPLMHPSEVLATFKYL